ncbi:hypothetical protein GCM10020295_36740 [Streptomyces cinereospinus]
MSPAVLLGKPRVRRPQRQGAVEVEEVGAGEAQLHAQLGDLVAKAPADAGEVAALIAEAPLAPLGAGLQQLVQLRHDAAPVVQEVVENIGDIGRMLRLNDPGCQRADARNLRRLLQMGGRRRRCTRRLAGHG